jgi:NADPH-dependent 2,4-dienoyl-CoA reductase/sulfur reductase-like enzyme
VVVLGGGVIGAEVASSARQLGLEVTIVDLAPVLMQRVIGDEVGERMAQLHRENGVTLRLGVSSASIVGDGKVQGVVVEGETLPADVVVLGIGAVPNVEWLAGSGLTIEDGVVCDEHLCAAPDVYAVGDVARWHHVGYRQTLRAEHWTTAIEHADAVARTLTGTPTTVGSIPYVWTDQYGKKLQIAGRLNPGDELIFVLDQDEPRKFVAVSGSDGVQHAAIAFAAPPLFIKQKQAMASGQAPWPPAPAPAQA